MNVQVAESGHKGSSRQRLMPAHSDRVEQGTRSAGKGTHSGTSMQAAYGKGRRVLHRFFGTRFNGRAFLVIARTLGCPSVCTAVQAGRTAETDGSSSRSNQAPKYLARASTRLLHLPDGCPFQILSYCTLPAERFWLISMEEFLLGREKWMCCVMLEIGSPSKARLTQQKEAPSTILIDDLLRSRSIQKDRTQCSQKTNASGDAVE